MSELLATINGDEALSVAIADGSVILSAASNLTNSQAVVETMTAIGDVDASTNGLVNGSLLVFKTTTSKWTATTTLDAQNMEGGEF